MQLTPRFLSQAPPAVRAEFEQHARSFDLPAGQAALLPGQACSAMSFVVIGSLRVYLPGRDGREITLYRVENGDGCVLTASCILGGAGFPAAAQVESRAAGRAVPAETFREWVARVPFWREYVFHLIGERIAAVLARFEESAFDSFDSRLARLLENRLAPGQLRLEATHAELANELGSAREVVSRTLERWQAAGLVTLHRGAIEILEQPRLKRLTGL